jgi:hypothetical protein
VRLDWAILSNSGEIQANLAYILGGGWDTAWRPAFPAPFLGALNLRIMVHPTEVTSPHQLQLQFWNEDGQPFAPHLDLTIGPGVVPPGHPVGWDLPALLAIGLPGLLVPQPGRYSVEILIDGQHMKSVPFRFVLGGPPSQPVPPLPPQPGGPSAPGPQGPPDPGPAGPPTWPT